MTAIPKVYYGSGAGSIGGTIAATQVAVGTALDTIGGYAAFTYDSPSQTLSVPTFFGTTIAGNPDLYMTGLGNFIIQPAGSVLIQPTVGTRLVGFADGFVKTTGGTGTLGVDATVYLSAATAATTYAPAGNYITALTGDGSAAGPGSVALTLATVNANVGSFTAANITVNAKGLITAAANGVGGGGNLSGTLTAPRVPFASGANTLVDDADMTFVTDTLFVPTVQGTTFQGDSGGGAAAQIRNSSGDATHVSVSTSQVSIKGDVAPSATGTYDIGSSSAIYTEIWGTTIFAGTVTGFGGGDVLTLQNNNAAVDTSIDLTGSDIDIKGTLEPTANVTYSLGSSAKNWYVLWVNTITNVDNLATVDFSGSGISIQSNTTGSVSIQYNASGRFKSDSTGISFFGGTTAAQQAVGTTLVNNVTSGGTTGTIANYTDLLIYANDAAAIRNNMYQLALKLQQLELGVKTPNLVTD